MLLHIFAMAVNLNAIREIPCQEVTWISKGTSNVNAAKFVFLTDIFGLHSLRRHWNLRVFIDSCPANCCSMAQGHEGHHSTGSNVPRSGCCLDPK